MSIRLSHHCRPRLRQSGAEICRVVAPRRAESRKTHGGSISKTCVVKVFGGASHGLLPFNGPAEKVRWGCRRDRLSRFGTHPAPSQCRFGTALPPPGVARPQRRGHIHYQLDAIPPAGTWLAAIRHRPAELVLPSSSRSGPRVTSAKAGAVLERRTKPR